MPWLSEAKKDVTSCDKPCPGANTRQAWISEWGNPPYYVWYDTKYQANPANWKHLSSRRKRKTKVIAQVVASERARAQTAAVTAATGL